MATRIKTGEETDYKIMLFEYLKGYKEKTIAGNKEFYEILEYNEKTDEIINHGGSTYPYEEEFRSVISWESASKKLEDYFLDKCDTFNISIPKSNLEWKNFLEENWYI